MIEQDVFLRSGFDILYYAWGRNLERSSMGSRTDADG
jgi:hypothetical protein